MDNHESQEQISPEDRIFRNVNDGAQCILNRK